MGSGDMFKFPPDDSAHIMYQAIKKYIEENCHTEITEIQIYEYQSTEAIGYLKKHFDKDLREGDLKCAKPRFKDVVDEVATKKARKEKLKELLDQHGLTMEDWKEFKRSQEKS